MYNDQEAIELVHKIANSKKYKRVYEKTIRRVVENCLEKYGSDQADKKARRLLHQIWGAYYRYGLSFSNVLDELKEKISNGDDIKESVLKILSIQSSTRERVPILDDFYRRIFSITGYPDSIIDHACGLNPLTILWMNLPEDARYFAFDIDREQTDFLNSVFALLGMEDRVKANLGDVLVDDFDYADLVFMLKLLPCLEHQQKGSSLEIMRKQRCKHLVISFPIKSLSCIDKGMPKFYSERFKDLMENQNWGYEEILFETELVFVVQKY